MITKYTVVKVVLGVALTAAFSACDGYTPNSAARQTAKVVITSSMKDSADSEALQQLIVDQPEVQWVIDCIAGELDATGWTAEQHAFFLQETGGTGNLKMVNRFKFTEEEMTEHFGPILSSSANCM